MERVEYELFYLVGESHDAELSKIRGDVEKFVAEVGGEFLPAETEEKRNLAYEINKERRGTYVARRFTLPGQSDEPFAEETEPKANPIDALTKSLKLYGGVLRSFILRADGLPELKPIPREERPKPTARRDSRRESAPRRYDTRIPEEPATVTPAPVAEKKAEEKPEEKKVTAEDLDKQLKEVLDI